MLKLAICWIKVIYNFILTLLVLNFLIGGNPFKGIHLTQFKVFFFKIHDN